MSVDQIASEALRLPAKERALLAASLWESLSNPATAETQGSDGEGLNLAIQREHELETGAAQSVPHDELMNRLRR